MYSHHSNGTNQATVPDPLNRTVLLEIGDWRLVRANHPKFVGIDSYPLHMMCGGGPSRFDNKCARCNVLIPDEIMALWMLHNWEQITSGSY